ncbi:NAD-dependent 4,6-dehydratase LegB [Kosmotoga sp. DU53]|uniref:NAD-dependent 4,6-dehydratase LegB n=1 Tax=Kosmotoga sp. DU53 TaxID=1310160 RepID=UPI0007C58B55|nr:NAD-dependent 4,6-dehydratase LegB [Kosmotoga sp. DU53]OAA18906.1 NAD-dependent dehydratase [Kosmotoga sp. DU53]
MKALVTGAAGFIGSHLVEYLVSKGIEVRAFVRYNSRNNWGWLEESSVKEKIEVYTGDIRDCDSVKDAVKGVDVVFHLAALIGIPYSYVSPLAYIKTNVEGTYNVLQAARELHIQRVVHTSTSEVYGTAQYVPIDEKHPINPQSPYAATKSGADQLAVTFYRSFGLPVSVIRPFNTFGPRQSARAVIPTIITQILAGKKKINLGNLDTTRDMNYVLNTVEGFWQVGLHDNSVGEVINLGSGREISIGDLANLIADLIGEKIEIEVDQQRIRPEKSEVERLLCDSTKARELTGWKPRYSLEEGLKATIGWLKEHMQYYKPDIYNV